MLTALVATSVRQASAVVALAAALLASAFVLGSRLPVDVFPDWCFSPRS